MITGEYLIEVLVPVVLVILTVSWVWALGFCGIPPVFHCSVGDMGQKRYDWCHMLEYIVHYLIFEFYSIISQYNNGEDKLVSWCEDIQVCD